MATAWLFPGQGTQRRGMGEDLFARFPHLTALADEVLGYSITELCLEDPDDRLATTRYCQPALYVVCCLAFLERRRHEPWPDLLAGHSMGEYGALFAAGSFDFETGLRLVEQRGVIMSETGTGSMLAVIGLGRADLDALIERSGREAVDIATYNLPNQHVLSAPDPIIRDLADELTDRPEVRTVHLHIGGAAHSRYSEEAARRFAAELGRTELRDPIVPTISNVTAQPYQPGQVGTVLAEQMRRPVRWYETMQYLHRSGVNEASQIGPGRVLDGLWERFDTSELGPLPAGLSGSR